MWWSGPLISTFRKVKQEDHKFEGCVCVSKFWNYLSKYIWAKWCESFPLDFRKEIKNTNKD